MRTHFPLFFSIILVPFASQPWFCKSNKSAIWLLTVIVVIYLFLGGKCASSTNSLLNDFPSLTFDKSLNLDDNLDHIVEESLKEFQSNLRRELGLTPNSIISADANPLPFEPKDDFYFYNNINTDSGATEQKWINYITTGPNQSFLSNGLFLDLDSVEFGDKVINLATTDSGLIVTEHQLNGRETIKDISKFEIKGIIASELVVLFNTTTNSEELVLFLLRHNGNSKALTWYSWNTESRKLHYNNAIKVDDFTSSIKLIHVPVTGDYMIAALQKNTVAMYMVDVQDGAIRLKLCNEIEALEVTAVEPFSINGQLYVAVGNGRANMSYIWKYRVQKEHFEFHQSLEDVNVTDLEYFHRGYEHYLAVVAIDKAVIYRWEGALFLRIQSIATSSLAQISVRWQAVHHRYSYPEDVTLLLISPNDVSQYVWNKYMGQFMHVEGTECVSWTRARQVKGILLPAQAHGSELEETKNDCIRLGRSCSGLAHRDSSWHLVKKDSATEKLVSGRILQKLVQPANKCWPKLRGASINVISFLVNDDYHGLIIATGRMLFFYKLYVANRPTPVPSSLARPDVRDLEAKLKEHEIKLQKMLNAFETMSSEATPEHDTRPKLEAICPDVEARMHALENRMEEIQKKISSSKNRTIHLTGQQKFGSIKVLGETIIEGNTKVKYVNNLDMPHFFQDSVMKKIPSRIRGTKTFLGKTTIEGNLKVRHMLNGYSIPEDFILLNRPQTLTDTEFVCLAPVTVNGDLDVKNHVNGFDLSKEAVLLNYPEPQYISGPKLFTSNVSVEEPVVVRGKVNNINISMMATNTVTTTMNRSIEGNKIFTNNVTILKHVISKTVKGMNIKRMEETTVKINEPTVVVAPKIFRETVVISGKAQLKADSMNGLRFRNDASLANASKGHMEVLGKVTILGNLTVGGKLDGIDLKDVALTKGNQTLCGKKKFTDAVFKNLRYKETDSDVDADVAIVHGTLRIVGHVNGMKLNELYEDIIYKNESRVVFKAPVTFAKVQSLSGVQVETNGLINGLDLTEDFIHGSSTNEEVTGTKTFTGPTTFNCDLNVQGTFDGVNLTEFSNQVVRLKGPPQTVSGVKTFVNGVTVNRLTDLLETDEVLHRPFITEMFKVDGNLNVTGKVNGVDFKRLAAKRLTLSTDQVITGSIWMTDANRVKNLRVLGTLNHVNISRLWNDILWKNSEYEQVVTGHKWFTGRVEIPSLVTMRGINGLAIEDVHKAAIYLDQGAINGSQIFAGTIEVDGPLTLSGKINGVDFDEMVKDTVMRSQPQVIKGVKVFESLRIKDNLSVESLVNGLKLERDVLTVNTNQVITGHYTFGEDVTLTDSAKVVCDLSANQVAYSQGDVETVTLRGNVKTDTLWTGGDLNGIDFIQLWMDAVHTTDSETVITGTKRFLGSVEFARNLNVLRTINDFDYPQFLRSIVTTDGRNQIITGLKEFTDSVEMPHVTCLGKVTIQGKLNDVEIDSMAALATPVVHSISGNVTIDGSLEVHGNVNFTDTLNGIRIPEDIMTNESDNVVSGRKMTKAIYVKGNIIVNHSVNSYNLSVLEMDTLKVDRQQLVTGQKTFKGGVAFRREVKVKDLEGNQYEKTRKESKSSELLMPEDDRLTFPTNVRFHGSVLFNRGLTINGQVYNNTAATEVQPHNQICSTSECVLLDTAWESFNLRANVIDSLQKIQTERGPFTDAKAELVRSQGTIFLVIGFPGCNTPLNIFSWSPRQQNMFPQGTLDLHSVYQILPIQRKHNGHMLVYHRDCASGENLTSLLAFENGIKPHRVLKQLPTSQPLAVDILVDGHQTIVAKIDTGHNLVIDNVAINGDEVSWSPKTQFALPVGASGIKWLPADGLGRNHRVLVGIDNLESHVYLVSELENVELVQVLSTPGILAYADVSYRHKKAVAFAQSDFTFGKLKIYSADADLKEADVLHGKFNVSEMSLESLEAGDKFYLVANYGDQVDIYVKEGDSSFLKKLGMSVNGVTFAKMFTSEARLYLLTLSSKEWCLSVVLMQGINLPRMNAECLERQL